MINNYCIYKHTSPSGKVYIGITSQKPEHRWRSGNGYRNHLYFYNAIQKYGWNNFKHEIIFNNLTKEEAEQKEIELIKKYKSNQKAYGYNIANGGNSNGKHSDETKKKIKENHFDISGKNHPMYGRHHSEETKQKMSKSKTGKKHITSEETRIKISNALKGREIKKEWIEKMAEGHKKSILQYSLDNQFIKKWNSIKDIETELGIAHQSIVACCKGRIKTSHNYIWKYECENKKKNKGADLIAG